MKPSDRGAAWVLLGDSFVNVYHDPALGFPEWETEEPIEAGFASHLSRHLDRPLHVIAMNGGGATGVRKAFAALPDNVVRSKEKVIWVLSARDLMLPEIPGRRAGIEWARVNFSDENSEEKGTQAEVVVTGRLRERALIDDPKTTPYVSALYSILLDEIEIESGEFSKSEALVFLWAFRDR